MRSTSHHTAAARDGQKRAAKDIASAAVQNPGAKRSPTNWGEKKQKFATAAAELLLNIIHHIDEHTTNV
jgi:hypothetical protein